MILLELINLSVNTELRYLTPIEICINGPGDAVPPQTLTSYYHRSPPRAISAL